MKVNSTLLLFLALFFFGACNLGDNEITQIITDIDDEFSIDLSETLSAEKRNFILQFASIELKECKNYLIDIEYELDANEDLNFYIKDIILPNEGCEFGRGIAIKQINLGELELGTYDLEINLRDAIVNKGELNISDIGYTLSLYTEHGLQVLHSELFRVPEQSIWGYIGYNGNTGSTGKLDDFIAGLQTLTLDIDLEVGYYGHFEWDGTNQISFPAGTGATFFRSFIFGHQRNIRKIKEYVQKFRIDNQNETNLKIQLFTAEGEVF